MGGSSPSGSTTTTTVQQSDPWEGQQPYLTRGFQEALRQYNSSKPSYYPGSTVVPYSPETEAALSMRTEQAVDPNSLVNLAGTETGRTLRGEYLEAGNPVFDQMLTGVTRQVTPQVDTGFARSGRFGSPLHAEALSRGITAGMMPYIQSERDRQYGATLDAGTVSQYSPELLANVGGAREAMGRQQLQERIDRHNFEQTRDAQKLAQYMGSITGNYGGTTNAATTQPYFSNSFMSGLGAAGGMANLAMTPFGGGSGVFGMK